MKKEKGAATILEYTIIFPVVLFVVFTIVFLGYALYEKAVLESAVVRESVSLAKSYYDPSYYNVAKVSSSKDIPDVEKAEVYQDGIVIKPYRFLLPDGDILNDAEKATKELIKKNQLFVKQEPKVEVEKSGGLVPKVKITAEIRVGLPMLIPGIELPPVFTIESSSVAYVIEPAEMIRNTDYAFYLVKKIDDQLGITDKITTVVSKIRFFAKK